MIHSKFAPSTLTFFASEITLFFGFLDFVHSCREAKVLDLPRWNTLFLFLALDCIIDVDVSLDTQLLQVFIELTDSIGHFSCGLLEFLRQFRLIQVDLTVFKVFLARNIRSSDFLICLPIFSALLLPFSHELLVFLQFIAVFCAFPLLDGFYQSLFSLAIG